MSKTYLISLNCEIGWHENTFSHKVLELGGEVGYCFWIWPAFFVLIMLLAFLISLKTAKNDQPDTFALEFLGG